MTISEKPSRIPLFSLTLSVVLFRLGYAMYRSVFSNFAGDELGLGAEMVGFLESVREIPGLLAILGGFLCFYAAEHVLAGVFLLIAGLGLMGVSLGSSFWSLAPTIFVFSIGFHFFNPLFNTLSLRAAGEEKAKVLGEIAGFSAAGRILAGILVFLIVEPLGIRGVLVVGGFLILVGAIPMFLFCRVDDYLSQPPLGDKRIHLRRKHLPYYTITFLDSVRRNIVNIFSPFALVVLFNVDVKAITVLTIANHLVTAIAAPQIGKLIQRIGNRSSLMLDYFVSTLIFVGSALIPNLYFLAAFYLVGNVFFFGFRPALYTYVNSITDPEEVSSTLFTGLTMNHISGFIVPTLGGILWVSFGYHTTFAFGAVMTLVALLVSSRTV